jgi:teichoic acid transport system ATP-binding protein
LSDEGDTRARPEPSRREGRGGEGVEGRRGEGRPRESGPGRRRTGRGGEGGERRSGEGRPREAAEEGRRKGRGGRGVVDKGEGRPEAATGPGEVQVEERRPPPEGTPPALVARELMVRFRPYAERRPTLRRHGLKVLRRAALPVVALDGVSLTLVRGQALGVIGANGAGKTTLLRVLAGTLPPDQGSVVVYAHQPPTLLSLGLGFNRKLSGRRNVYLGGLASGLTTAQIDEMFDDIVAYSEIGDAIDRPMGTYSSGMFARLAFAIAVRQEPDILLMDELLSVGDEAFKRKSGDTMNFLLQRAGAMVIVSHGLERLQRVCDTFAWLDHGRLLAVGPPREIAAMYRRHIGVPVEGQHVD